MKTIIIVVSIGLILMLIERLFPDQKLPEVKGWWKRVFILNVIQAAVVLTAGLTWEKYLQGWSLIGLADKVSELNAALICYVCVVAVFYWWHRWRHTQYFLWLTFHQVHHSPQRIETITSFYKHPLEIAVNSFIVSLISFTFLGISPETSVYVTIMTAMAEFFYHMNIKTPRWIGYFIQRPEMHRIHHERGRHFSNFSDLPIFDMMFGTFKNPETYQGACGYKPEREDQLHTMLLFRDVNGKIKKN